MAKRKFKRKRRHGKRKGKGRRHKVVMIDFTRAKNLGSGFPTELKTHLVAYSETTVSADQASSGTTSYVYRANGFGAGTGSANGTGPQVNFTGNYAAVYPTGLFVLLSNAYSAGGSAFSQGPYLSYYITRAVLHYRVLPNILATFTHAPAAYYTVVCWPHNQNVSGEPSSLLIGNMAEQPGASILEYQFGQVVSNVATASTLNVPSSMKWHKKTIIPWTLQGVSKEQYISDPNNWGAANADIVSNFRTNFAIAVGGTGGSAGFINYTVQSKIEYDVVFFDRNILPSTVNT